MYSTGLLIHSWLRWAVLVAGVVALARSFAGRAARRRWTASDDRTVFAFVMAVNLQMLLGLLLYFLLSPFTREALGNFGAAMKDPGLRFWAVEHPFGMLVSTALVHLGRARIRKAPDDRRHTIALIFFTLALVVMLASIPWPGRPNGRPLFRW